MRRAAACAMFVCLIALPVLASTTVTEVIPSAAPRGARVVLAGNGLHAADLAVTFSGAAGRVPARVTLQTAALAEVVVPEGAVAGDLRVAAGGQTIASFAFTVAPDAAYVKAVTRAASTQSHDVLKRVAGLAVSSNGTAYAADTDHHRIVAVSTAGAVTVLAGNGNIGYTDGPAATARFKQPRAIAFDATRDILYVADTGNHVIRRIAGGVVTTLAGSGRPEDVDATGAAAGFKFPSALAVDAAGDLYVADTGNNKIKRISAAGVVTTLAGGVEGHADGAAADARFRQPEGIAVTAEGDVIVADTANHRLRRIRAGVVSSIAGTSNPGFTDGPAAGAQFQQPAGIAVDDAGSIYVADRLNHAVRKIAGGLVSTIAGNGKPGRPDANLPGQLNQPDGIVSMGPLYIGDSGNDALRVVYQRLAVADLYPRSGDIEGGDEVRIFGSGFAPGETSVTFGGLPALAIQFVSDTMLIAVTPAGPVGTADVTVTTPAGTATLTNRWTWIPPFVALEIRPSVLTLLPEGTGDLKAFGIRSNGSEEELTAVAVWTISDATVAGIEGGKVTAKEPGSATVTAAYLTVSGNAEVIVETPEPLPPDPVEVAPPLPSEDVPSFADGVSFLYGGDEPIQVDVDPAIFDEKRLAVIRGVVTDVTGKRLGGVRVTIAQRPEFGSTLSRADGLFDLAVNGGELLTVELAKTGYLPVHREVNVPWAEFAWSDPVVMTALDTAVTRIDLGGAAMQAARGTRMTDQDGSRRAVVMFAPGTTAQMKLANGSVVPLTELNVRATEYSVGPRGPKAMPAPLPVASGYTYCVELSADEAIAAGATTVEFSKPVWLYVDNFLNFPVGGIVPIGYYDRMKGEWIASPNGRVIKIVAVTGGIAAIDANGDGAADSDAALQALGITPEEQALLGSEYAAGKSIWRSPIPHFTPWDCNWPYVPPNDAVSPSNSPGGPSSLTNNPNCQYGSVIECENQVVRESVDLPGGLTLSYRSDRAEGFIAGSSFDIPVTGATIPNSLKRVDVKVTAGGKLLEQSFSPQRGLSTNYAWDGKDGYGRKQTSPITARVSISYVYTPQYAAPSSFGNAFGAFSAAAITADRVRMEIAMSQSYDVTLEPPAAPDPLGLRGWSLSAHHALDPRTMTLHRGTGQRQSAGALGATIDFYAGLGTKTAEGTPAREFKFGYPAVVEAGPDGSLYVADIIRNKVYRISPEGRVYTFAGSGGYPNGSEPASGAATSISIYPMDLIVGSDGAVYIAEQYRIRRIRNGFISTIAGTGQQPDGSVTGKPALESKIAPLQIAIRANGELFFKSSENTNMYRIDSSGLLQIATHVGYHMNDLGFAPDGELYYAQSGQYGGNEVWKWMPFIFSNRGFAGFGTLADSGVPAGQALFGWLTGLAFDRSGAMILASASMSGRPGGGIARITSDKVRHWIAGNGKQEISGDGGLALAAGLGGWPDGVTVAPNGDIFFVQEYGHLNRGIRRIRQTLTGYGAETLLVPLPSENAVMVFDANGRHQATRDARTGATRWTFGYDANGKLTSASDASGNSVTFTRADGQVTATSSGSGAVLQLNEAGELASVTSRGVTHSFTYRDGLLISYAQQPSGATSTFDYDGSGRLIAEQSAETGSKTLTRSGSPKNYTVEVQAGQSAPSRYQVEQQGNGRVVSTVTDSAGLVTRTIRQTDGSSDQTLPNGVVVQTTVGPDPRWGMSAPVTKSTTITTPGALKFSQTHTRTASLSVSGDPFSLTSETSTSNVNGRAWTSTFTRADGKIRTVSPLGRVIERFVDGQGRVTEVRVPGLATATLSYDAKGRPSSVSQGGRTFLFAWNDLGELTGVTDPQQKSTLATIDAAGRVEKQSLPDGSSISFTYDDAGNVASIAPPGRPAHSFTYNEAGQPLTYTPPLVPGSGTTRFSYDDDFSLTGVLRPDGAKVELTYDSAGRVATMTAGDRQQTLTYDPKGNLASVSDTGGSSVAYAWDGSLPTQMSWSGPVAGSVRWVYDNNLRVVSESAGTSTVAFAYDADGFLAAAGALTLRRDAQNAAITGSTLDKVVDAWTWSSLGEMSSYSATVNGTAAYAVTWTRDENGRISSRTETLYGVPVTDTYRYDDAGRLSMVTRAGGGTSSYEYDGNGNRLRRIAGGVATDATYDAQDRLLTYGGITFTYNAVGELVTKTEGTAVTRYAYDAVGTLEKIVKADGTTVEYVVDGQNRRVGKKVNGTLTRGWLYSDQLRVVAELDGSGAVVSRFVYGARPHVPDYMIRGGVTYRIISDHLGSPRVVVDAATGAIAQMIGYDEFGVILSDTNPGFQPFGFAGGLYDADTGLVRFGARDYDPAAGRFVTPDPIGFDGGDTNLYAYVLNNPVNLIDPAGTDWVDALETVSNGFAGFGDTISFGATRWAREAISQAAFGTGSGVDECSGAYAVGHYAGVVYDYVAMAAGAGAAKGLFTQGGKVLARNANGGAVVRVMASRSNGQSLEILKVKDVLRLEAHPTARWQPRWFYRIHGHVDYFGTGRISKIHLPVQESLAYGAHEATSPNCGCD